MSKSKRLIFFGNERLASGLPPIKPRVLPALLAANYDIVAVVVNNTTGRSRRQRPLEIAGIANRHKVKMVVAEEPSDIQKVIAGSGAVAGVLVAYGQILPESIIDSFPVGIVNIHPSLLPKYRGPAPVEQVILDGASETGVSLMKLTATMDSGPVFAQQKYRLEGAETKIGLADALLKLGSSLLIEHLPAILDGSLSATQQDDSAITYTKLFKKSDGWINFGEPAEIIEHQVRAYYGFPKARAKLSGHEVVITKARVANSTGDGSLVIKCQPGWLEILELIAPSGRLMNGADYLRGYAK